MKLPLWSSRDLLVVVLPCSEETDLQSGCCALVAFELQNSFDSVLLVYLQSTVCLVLPLTSALALFGLQRTA